MVGRRCDRGGAWGCGSVDANYHIEIIFARRLKITMLNLTMGSKGR